MAISQYWDKGFGTYACTVVKVHGHVDTMLTLLMWISQHMMNYTVPYYACAKEWFETLYVSLIVKETWADGTYSL